MQSVSADAARTWFNKARPYTAAELIADGVVHGIGLIAAAAAGSVLLVFSALETAPQELPALILYVSSLIGALAISLAFNLVPSSPVKRFLARLDAHLAALADEQARRTFLDRQLQAWQRRYGRFISTHGACESIGDPADPPQAADFLVTIAALAARRRALENHSRPANASAM